MSTWEVPLPNGTSVRVQAPDQASAVRQGQARWASMQSPAPAARPPPQPPARTYGRDLAGQARQMVDHAFDAPRPGMGGAGDYGSGEANRQYVRQYTSGLSEQAPAIVAAGIQGLKNLFGGPVTMADLVAGKSRPTMHQMYDAVRKAEVDRTAELHSVINDGAGWAGGLAGPAPAAKWVKGAQVLEKGAPLAARAGQLAARGGRAAVVGGAIGTVSGGANAPTLNDVPADALRGGAFGAATGPVLVAGGAAAAPVIKATVRLATGASRRLGGAAAANLAAARNAVAGEPTAVTPAAAARGEQQAQTYFADRLRQLGINPEDIAAHPDISRGITVAEAGGPSLVQEAVGLVKRPGTTANRAFDLFTARGQDFPARLADDVEHHTGISPVVARKGLDALVAKGQAAVKPMFEDAFAKYGAVMNNDLKSLLKEREVLRAMNLERSRLRMAGLQDAAPAWEADPESGLAGFTPEDLASLDIANGQAQPTLRAWDLVRKRMDRSIEKNPDGSIIDNGKRAGTNDVLMQGIARLTDNLRAMAPEYGDALDASAELYLKPRDAAATASNMLFNKSHTAKDISDFMAGLGTDAERQAVKQDFARQLYDKIDNGDMRPSLFVGYGGGTRNSLADKLATVFGHDQAASLIAGVHAESALQATGARIRPLSNSTTGEAAAAAAEHDAAADEAVRKHLAQLDIKGAIGSAIAAPFRNAFHGAQSPGSLAFRDALGRLVLAPAEDLPLMLPPAAPRSAPRPGYRLVRPGDLAPLAVAPAANVMGQNR